MAGATVAGHLIECGTQVTGGISTDWLDVPRRRAHRFSDRGSRRRWELRRHKAARNGRLRHSELTVKEQLVYEIGDPANYLSPDVAVSFLSLEVEDLGNDRVRVGGATGKPRPEYV